MDQARSPSPTGNASVMLQDVSTEKSVTKRPRKKNKRPKKRFLWQEDLHLRFVAAIFDLGLKNASPKALLPLMNQSDPESGLTTEHLKSHLQKYRVNYERSRREFHDLCDREVKRDRKRRRRHSNTAEIPDAENTSSENIAEEECHQKRPFVCSQELAASIADSRYPDHFQSVPVSSGIPELTDAQWRTFSTLMSTPDPLSIQVPQVGTGVQPQAQEELQQMHQAMQAQMNFHRQMLTRKVELSNELWHMGNWNLPGYQLNVPAPEPSAFQQAWTSTQQIHQRQMATHRLQQSMTQIEPVQYRPDAPNDSLLSLVSRDPVDTTSEAVGEDLNRWDAFNVGLGDDELFDFLEA
ncbi:hypothetical protein V7S43_018530 [Phytophthora oleae]|uniref:HTH myb-type domain-containing protein n=1 Tax=Phytophthora oleae TaxID=2107226 RepID=A0ABD3EQB2_9STRA